MTRGIGGGDCKVAGYAANDFSSDVAGNDSESSVDGHGLGAGGR